MEQYKTNMFLKYKKKTALIIIGAVFFVALDRLLNQSRKQNFFTAKTLDRVVRLRSELARIISEINAQNG